MHSLLLIGSLYQRNFFQALGSFKVVNLSTDNTSLAWHNAHKLLISGHFSNISDILWQQSNNHTGPSKVNVTKNLPLPLATKCTPRQGCRNGDRHILNALPASFIFGSQHFLHWKYFYILNISGFPLLSFWTQSFSYTKMYFGKNSCMPVAHSMKIQLLPTNNSEHGSCWLHLMLLTPLPIAGSCSQHQLLQQHTLTHWHHILSLEIWQTEGYYFTKTFLPQKPICIFDSSCSPPVKLPVQLHPFRHEETRAADSAQNAEEPSSHCWQRI